LILFTVPLTDVAVITEDCQAVSPGTLHSFHAQNKALFPASPSLFLCKSSIIFTRY